MSVFPARRRVSRLRVLSKSNMQKRTGPGCVCEPVERRVLLSVASFATPQSVSVSGARAPVVAARFNGSGHPIDLAVATATAVQILTGSSNGTFTLGSSVPFPANSAAESPFQVGNYSGSGTSDIVLDSHDSGTGDGDITYQTDNGNGTFTAGSVSTITDGGNGFTPVSGRTGDFNGDGESDLAIIGKPGTGSQLVLAILISNGDGTFTEKADYPIAGSNAAGSISNEEVFTGITNEIVVYDGSGGNLDVFSGVGDGTFTQLTPTPLAAGLLALATVAGTPDLAVADGNQVSLLLNQGDGTFQADPQGPITLGGPITALATGDFNLDGNLDIITNQGILFGNGDGTFNTTPQALPVSIGGGNNFSNTSQAVDILSNGRQGFVGFAAAGNAVVSAVNDSHVGVSIDLESSNNPANPGSDVQFTATVSSAASSITATPTGEVTFFNGANALGMKPLSSGTATYDAGSSLSGSNSITAQYSGDATFSAATSSPLAQTVTAPTLTSFVSNENPSQAGDDVVFTATVSGNDGAGDVPSGNVEFFDNGTDLGGGSLDSTGSATFDTTGSLPLGSNSISAQYQGDSNFSASSSTPLTQIVNQPQLSPAVTATTLPSAIVAGAAVHGTVSISLTNHTTSEVSAQKITVFASGDGAIVNATPVVSETSNHGISIKPGQTVVLKLTVKSLPAGLANGTYKLLAQVSSSLNQVSNSSTGPSVTVAAPFVHLAGAGGTGIVKPGTLALGKSGILTLTLSNAGNIQSGAASINIGLSTDGQTESTELQSSSAAIKVKPGHSGVLHLHLKIPSTVVPGAYHAYVSVTDDGDTATIIGPAFTVVT